MKKKQQFVDKVKRQNELKLQELKLAFFSNISHEIKTPLTLIKSPLESLLKSEKLSKNGRYYVSLIESNTERLLRLTNQLLDYRKMNRKQLPLDQKKIDLVKLITTVCELFQLVAIQRQTRFSFRSTLGELSCELDQEKMESIIFNLLTNAFKYTPSGGEVSLELSLQNQKNICLSVLDSGKGIDESEIAHIFDPFYSNSDENAVYAFQKGTGLGLNYVKTLVELMKGDISVENRRTGGTAFHFTLSPAISYVEEKKIVLQFEEIKNEEIEVDTSNQNIDEDSPVLLLAEDNNQMSEYIASQFRDVYKVIIAENGQKAFDLAIEHMPDLVITDVMMPVMDGVTFCHKLKNDLKTSHIPVMMLTAKAREEDAVSGFESGADAYITKPFSVELLKLQAAKLIEGRKALYEKFSKTIHFDPAGITFTSLDNDFMTQLIEELERRIDDSSLSVEDLATFSNLSVSQFYKKVKAITNISPNEFIRELRLKKGAEILVKSDVSVSQVAYQVGFSDPGYFTKCFKKHFECTPKQYREKQGA